LLIIPCIYNTFSGFGGSPLNRGWKTKKCAKLFPKRSE
jgi:hypothetical protein